MSKKLITYVLTVSRFFPKYHPRAGQPTCFISNIGYEEKIHTIRANYPLWEKRIAKVNAGEACLAVRYWSGVPYHSKQIDIIRCYKNGVGIEKLQLDALGWFINDVDSHLKTEILARNDGLSLEDFKSWFAPYDLSQPMAIIHFTDFRYSKF